MSITPSAIILDRRSITCFKKNSFSNFLQKDVIKALTAAIERQSVPAAARWSAELLCSGAAISLCDTLLTIYCEHINVANVRMASYLLRRIGELRRHVAAIAAIDPLQIRNDPAIRRLVAEVMAVMALSVKKRLIPRPVISAGDFTLEGVAARRRSAVWPSPIESIMFADDAREILIPAGELYDALIMRDSGRGLYWLAWFIEWSTIAPSLVTSMHQRATAANGILPRLGSDSIWLVCDIIRHVVSSGMEVEEGAAIDACLEMFTKEFCTGGGGITCKRRRAALLQIAIQIICERPTVSPLVAPGNAITTVNNAVGSIDAVYGEIRRQTSMLPTAGDGAGGSEQKRPKGNKPPKGTIGTKKNAESSPASNDLSRLDGMLGLEF